MLVAPSSKASLIGIDRKFHITKRCAMDQKGPQAALSVTSTQWAELGGTPVTLITLQHSEGSYARFTDYGARLVALGVPDRNGNTIDVVTGYDTLDGYLTGARFFGANVGPFANRIRDARFTIDGIEYRFKPNGGTHLLHSGLRGLDSVLWKTTAIQDGLQYTYQSPDGEFGFPGPVDYSIRYKLLPGPTLSIEYTAVPQKATHLNIAHHSYFNLAGHNAGTIADHMIQIYADKHLEVDEDFIPTGKMLTVQGTPLDLRDPTLIADRLTSDFGTLRACGGFDQCFVINYAEPTMAEGLKPCARVTSPATGIAMEIHSSYPGLQFYTANHDLPPALGKGGAVYRKHGSFCLEPQFFPNSPNIAQFPSTLVRPGEVYRQNVEFRFSGD
jgi:aldose 1-epimerase